MYEMKLYLRLLRYLSPYKTIIILTWILSVLVIAMQAISVWVGAEFIEKIIAGVPSELDSSSAGVLVRSMNRMAMTVLQQSTPFKSLLAGVAVLVGSAFLIAIFRVMKTYLFARVNQTILTQIRSEMFLHITRLDLSFSRKFVPGNLASLFIRNVDHLKDAIIDAVDRGFMQPLRLIMAVVLMVSLSFELTVYVMLLLLASSLVIHLSGDKIEGLTRQLLEKAANVQGYLTDYLSAVILARSLGREQQNHKSFLTACQTLATSAIESNVVLSIAPQMISSLFVLSGGILLILGGYKVLISHTMTGSDLIKMLLLLPMATYPIQSLASLYISIRISVASAKRVFGLLDEEPTFQDDPDALDSKPLNHAIKLDNVGYTVDGITVIKNLSLLIPRGSTMVLYGPSGGGKTTVLSMIAGLTKPTKGAVLIDGINLNQLKGEQWRHRVGVVIQEAILINGTIRENLLYACPTADDRQLVQVLKEVLLWDTTCVFPQGLDTEVGNRGELISGGERQRLAIARSLLKDPDLLLLDEPTVMLDEKNKNKIKTILTTLTRKRTIVIATHDKFLVDIADIEVKIDAGKIVEKMPYTRWT